MSTHVVAVMMLLSSSYQKNKFNKIWNNKRKDHDTVNPSQLFDSAANWTKTAVPLYLLSVYLEHHPSIHPSIHLLPLYPGPVAGAAAWAGTPRLPSPRTFSPVLPGGSQGVPRPAEWHSPGSSSGSPPGGACQEHLPWNASREPPQLAPLDVEQRRLYSELLPGDRAPHPSLRERPATLRRKLISAACVRDLILLVTNQSSWQ